MTSGYPTGGPPRGPLGGTPGKGGGVPLVLPLEILPLPVPPNQKQNHIALEPDVEEEPGVVVVWIEPGVVVVDGTLLVVVVDGALSP